MSWRDSIKQRSVGGTQLVGSFRGVRFIVPVSDASYGRRTEIHEYPLRDIPYAEDLGKRARRYAVEVFVDGTLVQGGDYTKARDALIGALEQEGSGTLVHPWYGTMTVSLENAATVRESTKEGGRATFRMTFVEDGGLRFPDSGQDTAWKVDDAADAAITASADDFSSIFDISGLPEWGLAEMEGEVYATLSGLEQIVGSVAGTIASEIRAPANMAAALIGSIQLISAIASEPKNALGLYETLFTAGNDSDTIPVTTAVRRQQAASVAALRRVVQQTAIIEAARSSSQATYATRNDALIASEKLLAALDAQMEETDPVYGLPVSDAVFNALHALRTAVANDLRTRGSSLPELTTYTPSATLPALVVAHNVYGDASREQEIVDRNAIKHPGFVPGGDPLEVLSV